MIGPSEEPGARKGGRQSSRAPRWHARRTRGHHRPGRSRRRPPADVPAGTVVRAIGEGCPHRRGRLARPALREQEQRGAGLGIAPELPGAPVGLLGTDKISAQPAQLGQLVMSLSDHRDVEVGKLFGGDRGLSLGPRPVTIEAKELDTMHPADAAEHDGAGKAVAPALGRCSPLTCSARCRRGRDTHPSAGSRCCPPIRARAGRRAPATSPHRGARTPRPPGHFESRPVPSDARPRQTRVGEANRRPISWTCSAPTRAESSSPASSAAAVRSRPGSRLPGCRGAARSAAALGSANQTQSPLHLEGTSRSRCRGHSSRRATACPPPGSC